MNKLNSVQDKQFIFGMILVVANRLDTLLERELNPYGMTSKQWFLSIITGSLFEKPPTIKEVAAVMGTSHQNVKQIALKLEQKGHMKLIKDARDARVTRLVLTEQSKAFWEKLNKKGEEFMSEVFENLSNKELKAARTAIQKIWQNTVKLEAGRPRRYENENIIKNCSRHPGPGNTGNWRCILLHYKRYESCW